MSRKRQYRCLVVGDSDQPDVRAPIQWLAAQPNILLQTIPSAVLKTELMRLQFDLIILPQPRPGQLSSAAVDRVRRAWPQATIVNLFGDWCEGEGRSGRPLSGIWRVSAASFVPQMRHLLSQDPGKKRASVWRLPELNSEVERLGCEAQSPIMRGAGTVLIATQTLESFLSLSDAIALAGFSALWESQRVAGSHLPEFSAAIWDAAGSDERDWREASRFVQQNRAIPMLMLMGFPRAEDFARAKQWCDASSQLVLLAKPLRLPHLLGELSRMTTRSQWTTAESA